MKTIAISNVKGGTGKTSTTVHFADGLARAGKRVLVVDIDSQSHATEWLGYSSHGAPRHATALDALTTGALPGPLLQVKENLFLLPADQRLAGAELQLAQEVGGTFLLRKALEPLARDLDLVLIDCPPNLGLTVLSALCAADAVVVPVVPSCLSISGLLKLEDAVSKVRERLGAPTRILGYLLFAADARENITAETRKVLRSSRGDLVFDAQVRISTAAKLLPARHVSAFEEKYDPRGEADYRAVIDEMFTRLGKAA